MSIAFVLTGGGSLGAVQVGMLTALLEHGIRPDLLVGTSVGAVNAAYLGGPGRLADRLSSLADLWVRMRRHDVFALDLPRWVGAARGVRPSFFGADGLDELLRRNLGYDELEHARIPVAVTVTDLVTGQGLVLDGGPVVSAVRASAAVPGVFPPVTRDGRTLVDGAIGELDVLTRTASRGVSDLYLLPAGYPCAGNRPTTALGTALTALTLVLHRQLMAQVSAYDSEAALHIVPPLCPLAVSPADFTQAAGLLSRAHASTSAWLGARRRPDSASDLALHVHHRPPRDAVERTTDHDEGQIS